MENTMAYSLFDLDRFLLVLDEALHDIVLFETNGEFDLADEAYAAADEARFFIAEFRNAGISEEFPGGEFAVVGVNYMMDAYDGVPDWAM